MSTWESNLEPSNDEASDSLVWTRLRLRRDQLLIDSDWTQVADAPVDQASWQAYRQALRDLPDNTTDPRTAPWPVAPSEEGSANG